MENELLALKVQNSGGGAGGGSLKIWDSLHSGARIRVFEQKRKHKLPLKLLRM